MKKDQSSAPFTQLPTTPVIIAVAIFVFFAILLFLALFSYNPLDPAWRHNNGDTVSNTLGTLGAWYSDLSFSLFGKLSYLLPISLIGFAVLAWREKTIEKEIFSWRLFMLLTAVLSGSVLWAKHDPSVINTVAQTGGGAVGSWLATGLEKSVRSVSMIMAFSTTIFVVSISLLFNIPWGRLADKVGAGVCALFANVVNGSESLQKVKDAADVSGLQSKIKGLNRKTRERQEERYEERQNAAAVALAQEAGIAEEYEPHRPQIDRYQPEIDQAPQANVNSPRQGYQQPSPAQQGVSSQQSEFDDQQMVQKAARQPQISEQRGCPEPNIFGNHMETTPAQPSNVEQSQFTQSSTEQSNQQAPVQAQPVQQVAPEPVQQPRVRQSVAEWLEDIDRVANRNAKSAQKPQPQPEVTVDDLLNASKQHGNKMNEVVENLAPIPEARPKRVNVVEDSPVATPVAQPRPQTTPNAVDVNANKVATQPVAQPVSNQALKFPDTQGDLIDVDDNDESTKELLSKIKTRIVNQGVTEPLQAFHSADVTQSTFASRDDELSIAQPSAVTSQSTITTPQPAQAPVAPHPQVATVNQPSTQEPAIVQAAHAHQPLSEINSRQSNTVPQSTASFDSGNVVQTTAPASSPTITPIAPPVPMATEKGRSHELPSIQLLDTPPPLFDGFTEDTLAEMAGILETTLQQFKINAIVMRVSPGPVITRFELELAPGIPAKKITALSKDLARSLAVSNVRVEEVVPGSSYVGLEVPNKQRQTVYFRDIVGSKIFRDSKSPLSISLGSDTSGKPKVVDLMGMPHALVAGTTGSGKSVCINVMLLSLLFKATPKDVRLILVDPKMLELSMYEGIPHLLTPVITDMNEAENALAWAVGEMERRYQLMSALKVRKIDAYNEHVDVANAKGEPIKDPLWQPDEQVGYTHHPSLERLPYIVVVIDELADMMMVVGKQVEQLIARLTQKARAAGIHVVIATQRPSTDVLTGLIKANVPTRLAFQVSSQIDSRVIIDDNGAEKLLGNGDMLYVPPGVSHPLRLHGAFVGDAETERVTDYLRSLGEPEYIEGITGAQDPEKLGAFGAAEAADSKSKSELDPLYEEAIEIVLQTDKASISSVQRHLRIGYNRAARMIEDMQAQGIVSEPVNGIRRVIGRR